MQKFFSPQRRGRGSTEATEGYTERIRHGDFFKEKGRLYDGFHTHNSDLRATPRKTALITARFQVRDKNNIDNVVVEAGSIIF
ncbi:MAG: hypothetical protein H7122_17665 [Chitinophagaceae bacterium]|nr:hypothetical protein [Chitinophagaceae bacterium]